MFAPQRAKELRRTFRSGANVDDLSRVRFHYVRGPQSDAPLEFNDRKRTTTFRASSILRQCLALMLCVLLAIPVQAQEAAALPEPKPAKLKISGYGLLGNLRLKQMLRILQTGKKRPPHLDANYIEDAALLLVSRLSEDGYLEPRITARLILDDGSQQSFVWNEAVEEPLPRPLTATSVHFEIKPGVFYHFDQLEFEGLNAIPDKKARGYFVETGGLLSLKRNRVFAPEAMDRSLGNLTAELQRLGFQNATVTATNLHADPRTGAVDVRIEVREGPMFIVRSVFQELFIETNTAPASSRMVHPREPYSKVWEQDHAQSLRTNYFQRGYPDAFVELATLHQEQTNNRVELDMKAVVKTGRRIRVGEIGFTGNERTKDVVLERRLPLDDGDWLNRIRAEQGRYRLSRLGVFDSVELNYENVDEGTRNITYVLDEGKQIDVSLLFGWGSYEMLRGGVQVDQYNVFGRAHHQRLKAVQSLKSSNADYTYTMPEFFGENMDVFLNANGLRREEVSFTRLEYGGGAGVRKYFRDIHTDISTRYNYQILQAQDVDPDLAVEDVGLSDSAAAAIITDFNHDMRDNPLYPRKGHKLFANVELATDYLGGDVDYQRLELSGAWHWAIGDAQWIHFGASHGLVATLGSTAQDLPFNRRFFPGGENTVRGYQEGEAAPRNDEGKVIGAETYLLGNFEFEQGLTPTWSIVTFVDAVTFARRLEDYPGTETLLSVGGGLRWKTFIGPVRVEYGHNLNPRRGDPAGTLHFSLGFPF